VIVVISGPGGVGKGTLVARLLEAEPDLWLSRSWTTRAQRPGESDDAYAFVDRATFERRLAEGGFLEHNEFLGNLYGTPVPEPGPGQDVLLEIDVNGAEQVLARDAQALFIFLVAPSLRQQRARLEGRGDAPEMVERRLVASAGEAAMAARLGARVVVNDDLDRAVEEVRQLITERRSNDA
jgi:guanylate kinase